ncbi:Probable mediator of RNA polymerase II transcription subunit 26c [Linum grandiflorum]
MMDSDDLRSILETAGVDVWELIDSAIAVASSDYPSELKQRRDKIVEALFSSSSSAAAATCNRCAQSGGGNDRQKEVDMNTSPAAAAAVVEREAIRQRSPVTPVDDEFEEEDPYAGLFEDDIETRVMDIKQQLEDPDQSEDSLAELLQTLDDMDITFKALKESDIGRHVNRLRKNPSNEVKRLVKKLVRKWKEIVDEWVRLNPQGGEHGSSALMADGDSPQPQRITQNGNYHHQVPDFAYSPNPNNGSSGSDRNYSEPEVVVRKPKPPVSGAVRREAPTRPAQQYSSSAPPNQRQQQQRGSTNGNFNSDRLASASKRLQESYKEVENAKKQRTIQVMDLHDLPKPKNKNIFFAKNKGGSSQGRHW